MEPHKLYAFSYFDELRGRWLKARYRASLQNIRERYRQFRIEGEPEVRNGNGGQFVPPRGRS